MSHLYSLTPIQIRALIRLDDGLDHDDSVGQEITNLSKAILIACSELLAIGLVEVSLGWRGTVWLRLTAKGRAVREAGQS